MAGTAIAVMKDDRGLFPADLTNHIHQFRGGDTGFRFCPLRGKGLNKIPKLPKASCPSIYIGFIIQSFLEDNVNQGIIKRQIRTGPYHPISIGLRCRHRHSGVDIGQLGPIFLCLAESLGALHLQRLIKIPAIQHHVAGILVIYANLRIGVAKKRPGGGIDRSFAERIVGKMIGGTQRLHEGFTHMCGQISPLSHCNAFRSMDLHNRFQFFRHIVQCLIP